MIKLTRVELLKLRTIRLPYGLLAASAALTALFAALEASRAGNTTSGVAALYTAAGLSTVTTVTGWSMLFAGILGVTASSGEFRHASATLTYLANPNRVRVLFAKALAAAGVGAIFGLVSAGIATGVGLAFVAGHHYQVALAGGTIARHAAGAMVGAALLAAVGVGIGSLIRSQLAGVIGVFVWGLVVESVIGGLFTSVRPYLPYTAATTLAGIKLGGAAFGPAHGVGGGSPLPFMAAAALVAGVAALISFVASRTTVPADIT
jgi:ABC-2 type transport system permease protein